MGFSDELKVKTNSEHSTSDKFVNSALALSLSDRKVYRMAVYRFYHVFKTIEEQLADKRLDCEALQLLYFPTLSRVAEFEDDVLYFYPEGMPEAMSPALSDYIDNIQSDTGTDPANLIGYLQTMQMAILSGGKLIRPVITRVLGLQKTFPLGVKALDWPEGFNTEAAKRLYRERLDGLELTQQQRDNIIDIKKKVFRLNDELIREVIKSPEGSKVFKNYAEKVIIFLFALCLLLYCLHRYYSV